ARPDFAHLGCRSAAAQKIGHELRARLLANPLRAWIPGRIDARNADQRAEQFDNVLNHFLNRGDAETLRKIKGIFFNPTLRLRASAVIFSTPKTTRRILECPR